MAAEMEKGPASHPAGVGAVSGGMRVSGSAFFSSPALLIVRIPVHFLTALVLDEVHILRFQPDTFPGLALFFLLGSLACTKG